MMKKVLLVGELNEIVRSLNECLADDFQVQLCSEELANVQAMVRIVKPELIIICQIGVEEIDSAIFTWIREKCAGIPVLGTTTSDAERVKKVWGIKWQITTGRKRKL